MAERYDERREQEDDDHDATPNGAIGAYDRDLPAELGDGIAAVFDLETSPATVEDVALAIREAVRRRFDRSVDLEMLCHSEDGDHVALTAAERYRFRCPLDAVAVPALTGSAVTIRTPSPAGDPVTVHATESGITADPPATVFSVGADPDGVDGSLTLERVYGAVCPTVRAFPDRAAYEEWAAATDAPTVALSPPEALAFADALVGEPGQ